MAFNFSFFGTNEHRVFNYKPRYYDVEKEELKRKFGHVDGSMKDETYVPGSYIKGSFRNGNYQRQRGQTKAQKIIGLIALVLMFVVIFFIAKMWPYMLAALGVA